MFVRDALPEHHLSADSKDVVKLGIALIATMSALVLSLLVASAKGAFDTRSNQLVQTSADIIDAGRILNPALFDGQVHGGFAMAIGAALYERFVCAEDGGFLTGSFADYAVPTASMIPELEILHMESPSPVTPLGAKGVAEGNAMSTPVCIANAVAGALGVAEISVPLTPERILELLRRGSSAPRHKVSRR